MAHLGLHTDGAPWPFKTMEIGDVIICTHPRAASTAHAYGASTKKKFSSKLITNKVTGEPGYRIERISEDDVRANRRGPRDLKSRVPRTGPVPIPRTAPGRRANLWPFELLEVGQSWSTTDPEMIRRAASAAGARNTKATYDYRAMLRSRPGPTKMDHYTIELHYVKLYRTRTETDPRTLMPIKVTIDRLPGTPRIRKDARSRERALSLARNYEARGA